MYRRNANNGESITYGVSIGVGSNLRMQPNITSQIIRVGEPILLSAPGPAMAKNFLIASIIGHNNKDKNDVLNRYFHQLIDNNLSIAAKHSKLKGLLNPVSISGGSDNPLVELEYKGRQSNVILTTQGRKHLEHIWMR
ncbi:MAG: hypothetical protein WA395_08685 [Nitrososphaeraceae archaeon]